MTVYSYANIRVRMRHSILRLPDLRGLDRLLREHEPLEHEALFPVHVACPHIFQQRVLIPLDLRGDLLLILAFIDQLTLDIPPPRKKFPGSSS